MMVKLKGIIDRLWCALIWLFPLVRLHLILTDRNEEKYYDGKTESKN